MMRVLAAVIVIHAGGLLADPGDASAAIAAATSTNAETLDMHDRLGRIRPGFEADLIAVESDPALDVAKLRTVSFVMKGGAIVVDRAVTDRGQQPPK